MTQQEKTILDQQLRGVTVKIVWGFVYSIAIGVFTACACYFSLRNKIEVMQVEIAHLKEQMSEMRTYNVTKN